MGFCVNCGEFVEDDAGRVIAEPVGLRMGLPVAEFCTEHLIEAIGAVDAARRELDLCHYCGKDHAHTPPVALECLRSWRVK